MGKYKDTVNGVVPTVKSDKRYGEYGETNPYMDDILNGVVPTNPNADVDELEDPEIINGVVKVGPNTEDYLKGPTAYTGPNDAIRYFSGEGKEPTYAKLENLSNILSKHIMSIDDAIKEEIEADKQKENGEDEEDYVRFLTGEPNDSDKEKDEDDDSMLNFPDDNPEETEIDINESDKLDREDLGKDFIGSDEELKEIEENEPNPYGVDDEDLADQSGEIPSEG
ncbi:MAG: hypothetical protein ACPLX8_00415, partial [Nanopusillaceae archaeon]